MGRSLGLAAYRALSRHRHEQSGGATYPPRPPGEIVWCHATDIVRLSALSDIARRLRLMRPNLKVLITIDEKTMPETQPVPRDGANWIIGVGADTLVSARQFLTHWQPNVCLWTGGGLMTHYVSVARAMKTTMILSDVGEKDFQLGRRKWFPDLGRSALDLFDTIVTNSDAAARVVRRMGVSAHKVSVAARLRLSPLTPVCSEDDLTTMMNDLGGRPIWLAALVQRDEIDAILCAHRAALKMAHRLLLILVLADPADAADLKTRLADHRIRFADWDNGERVEDNIQVLVCTGGEELGLWYRVAPLTFLASSLLPGYGGVGPLEAAALGSAVLYGPQVVDHVDAYARLTEAGAARTVTDGDSLAAALVQLVAPDHAAAMALAGWEVATEGADLTDRLVDLVLDALDQSVAADART